MSDQSFPTHSHPHVHALPNSYGPRTTLLFLLSTVRALPVNYGLIIKYVNQETALKKRLIGNYTV